jgi:hypothetical protein
VAVVVSLAACADQETFQQTTGHHVAIAEFRGSCSSLGLAKTTHLNLAQMNPMYDPFI